MGMVGKIVDNRYLKPNYLTTIPISTMFRSVNLYTFSIVAADGDLLFLWLKAEESKNIST